MLSRIYEHPDDVDLSVGGSLEKLLPGGLAGPTFTCIWLQQLKNIRTGDRFFYDHKDGSFTLEQIQEIRKASVSRWFCDNTRSIKNMQPKGFLLISEKYDSLHYYLLTIPKSSRKEYLLKYPQALLGYPFINHTLINIKDTSTKATNINIYVYICD